MTVVSNILNGRNGNLVIPAGSYIAIDLEMEWQHSAGVDKWWPYSRVDGTPNMAVINYKASLIKELKAIRPDCYFGFYDFPESNHYGVPGISASSLAYPHAGATVEEWKDAMQQAAAPVLDASDFIAPDFYFGSKVSRTTPDMISHFNSAIARTKKYHPNKKIIPLVFPKYYADWPSSWWGGKDVHTWTSEEVAQYSVPGADWRQQLDAFSANGVNDIFLYDDGTWMPWDNNAGWWLQTMDWLGVQNPQATLLLNAQQQLASISAAIQNLINFFKK
jgi:hypothetical protein